MKEWLKVSRAANGTLVVTVTLSEDNLSSRWSCKTWRGDIQKSVRSARKAALEVLNELREVAS